MDIMVIGTYELYENYGTATHPHWKPKGKHDELLTQGSAEELLQVDPREFDKLGMKHVIDNDACRYYYTDWEFYALDYSIIERVTEALEKYPNDTPFAAFESELPKPVWDWGIEQLNKKDTT